jgi:hypothetical protein
MPTALKTPTDRQTTTTPPGVPRAERPPPAGSVWPPRRCGIRPSAAAAASLLDEAEAGPADRVLIVGAPNAELLCDALRHGCRTALEVVAPPPHPEPADVVVAPRVAGEAEAAAIALCARRALGAGGPGGRLALSLLGHRARALARLLAERLRAFGFARIRLRARTEGGLLLVCLLPHAVAGPVAARATAAGPVRRSRR